ncbi:single-stranded DNA-binding protein [Mesorhizobium amorphae]
MMASLNKVQLMGRLGADPEIRRLNSGDVCVNLRIATSETWRDKNSGERKERVEWHQVVIFNQPLAKIAEQYLKKGHLVFVEGMLCTRKWQDQNGQDRYSVEVVLKAFNGELILMPNGERKGASGPDDYGQQSSRSDQRQSQSQQSPGMRELDDEIPF